MSLMGALPRVALLVLLASLALAAPARAVESSPGSQDCASSCGSPGEPSGGSASDEPAASNGTADSGNETADSGNRTQDGNAPANSTSGSGSQQPSSGSSSNQGNAGNSSANGGSGNGTGSSGSGPTDPLLPQGRCEAVRPTGTIIPYVSVNPLLGILTIHTECVTRYTKGIVYVGPIGT